MTAVDDRLIALLYSSVIAKTPWQPFLRALRSRIGANTVSITLRLPHVGKPKLQISDPPYAPDEVSPYVEKYYAQDPMYQYALKAGEVVIFEDVVDREQLINTEFYRDFLRPNDIIYGMKVCFDEPGGLVAWLELGRGDQQGNFNDKEKDYCRQLLPFLSGALQIYARLMRSETERRVYEETLERLSIGAIILDGNGRILKVNRTAGDILQHETCINRTADQLSVSGPDNNHKLRHLIQAALRHRDQPDHSPFLETLRLSGRHGDVGLLVKPIPIASWYEGRVCPSVMVYISDPMSRQVAPEQLLADLFAITPAEARLSLLLANGEKVDEVADNLGLSINTVRTQLKSVFAKTGTRSQPELIRLILRSVAFLA